MILLDTSVVSTVLRRRKRIGPEADLARRLDVLMATERPIALPGLVLQEVLSGIRDERQFDVVRRTAEATFPILLPRRDDHIVAAQLVNACRRRGVTASATDALIAAQAIGYGAHLFTTDPDFEDIAKHTPLRVLGE